MSVQDLIASGRIVISLSGEYAFSGDQAADIIVLLEQIYATPAGAALIDLVDQSSSSPPLTINFGSPSANPFEATVRMDPEFQLVYVNKLGKVVQSESASVLAHEIHHALTGQPDTTDFLTGAQANPDYLGPTVAATNIVMTQLGEFVRPSYSSGNAILDFADLGAELTFGKEIDVVLLTSSNDFIDLGQGYFYTTPGPSPSTNLNTVLVRDLIVDVLPGNNMVSNTGLGDDFIWAHDGNDRINAGDGNDFISGGDGDDLIHGGAGVDSVDGGAGHDTFLFNPTDAAVRIDLRPGQVNTGPAAGETYAGIEAVIGTDNADFFIVGSGQTLFAAGGAGRDTFVSKTATSTIVALGGVGPDVFRIDEASMVLAVNIPGLTQNNFHLLTQQVLEAAIGLPLSDFSMIIVNPDSLDRLTVTGTTIARQTTFAPITDAGETWADLYDANVQTASSPTRQIFNLPDGQNLEVGQVSTTTESGATVTALRAMYEHTWEERFIEYFEQPSGGFVNAGTGPGQINEWVNNPPSGALLEWMDTPELWSDIDPSGSHEYDAVEAFTFHFGQEFGYSGGFALVGQLTGLQISSGMTVSVPLPALSAPDWI